MKRKRPAKKPRYDLPNDFAYLSGDIIADIVDANMNPHTWHSGDFNHLQYVKGNWRAIARSYSFVKYRCIRGDPSLTICSGFNRSEEIQFNDLLPKDVIRRVLCTGNPSNDPNLSALIPRMTDQLEVTGTDAELASTLKLLPETFSEISIFSWNDSMPSKAERLALEAQVKKVLLAERLRKFACYHRNRPEEQLNLDDSLKQFVIKASFEELKTDSAVSLDVVAEAIESWRKRRLFVVPVQNLLVSFGTKNELEKLVKNLFPLENYSSNSNWRHTERHAFESDRVLTFETCHITDRILLKFHRIESCRSNESATEESAEPQE
uniref:F-box domain-containing protein n=1 Tax=Steinernema glaseri TaxID=37863 RepID=A0A1I7YXK6_9BILA